MSTLVETGPLIFVNEKKPHIIFFLPGIEHNTQTVDIKKKFNLHYVWMLAYYYDKLYPCGSWKYFP